MSTEQKQSEDLNTQLLDLVHKVSLADGFNEALAMLLEQARTLLPCDGISVMLLSGDHLDVVSSRGSTAPLSGLTLPASQMGAGRAVLDSSKVVVVADTAEGRRWERVPGEEQVRSWLGAPLPVEGRTIGLLTWSAKEPERFTREDAELAGRIASNVAPLLHRVQVLEDTRGRLRELVEPRLDLTPRATDLGAELEPIVLEALEYIQARHAFAFVRAENNHRLRCVAASGEQRDRLKRCTLRGDGTLGGWSVPMEGSSDWLSSGPSDREVMANLGIERTLILPLRACGKEVGMLGVAEPLRGRRFGRDAMRLMTHLASQASLSVERVSPSGQERKQYDYDMVIQSAPLGIGVLTVTGDIQVANSALAGQLSRSNRNLEGYNLSEFLLPRDARHLEHMIEEVAVTGQRRHMEAGIKVVSGEHRHVRISLALTHVSSDAGGNLVAVVEDVTSRKILEDERVEHLRELGEKHDQLKDLDEMKSRFVSNVSHELRTPLAVIKLYATLARKGRPEKQIHYLQTIEQETQRLETMVENILDLSRMDRQALRVHPELMDPEEVIRRVLEVYEETAKKRGVELRDQIQDDLPALWADKNHLIQILTNLLDNALKYTTLGGHIWIAAREVASDSGQMLEIEVGDTGAGIPKEEQERVFERFYRGSNNTPGQTGTGLGLAIVRELMLRHGGAVTLKSKVGEGSVFALHFPLYEGGQPPEDLEESEDADGLDEPSGLDELARS